MTIDQQEYQITLYISKTLFIYSITLILLYVVLRVVIYSRICVGTGIRSRNSNTLLVTLLSKIRHLNADANSTELDDQP